MHEWSRYLCTGETKQEVLCSSHDMYGNCYCNCVTLLPNDGFLTAAGDSSMFPDKTLSVVARYICVLFAAACLPLLVKKIKGSTLKAKEKANVDKSVLICALAASIFSVCLAIGGMVKQYKVFGFLDVKRTASGTWNGMALVTGGGVVVSSAAGYHRVKRFNYFANDKSCGKFNVPSNTVNDSRFCHFRGWPGNGRPL